MRPAIAWLLTLSIATAATAQDFVFSHSFVGKKSIPRQLRIIGRDGEDVVVPDAGGLRITPAPSEKQTFGWGVAANFRLSGDFEVTADYEVLAMAKPTKGTGSGVALNVVLDEARTKFAKIGLFALANGQVGYVAESWTSRNSSENANRFVPTTARGGKLRLKREGRTLRFQVSDAPQGQFREIMKVDFGSEDLATVRFVVNPNSSPTALEALLKEFAVSTGVSAETGETPVANGEAAVKRTILPFVLAGTLILILVVAAAAFLLMSRKRRKSD